MTTQKLNPYEITEMRRTMSNKQIAEYYQVTLNAYYSWCRRHNLITARITTYEVLEEIKTKTAKQIAYEYNVPLNIIYYRLKTMGVKPKGLKMTIRAGSEYGNQM